MDIKHIAKYLRVPNLSEKYKDLIEEFKGKLEVYNSFTDEELAALSEDKLHKLIDYFFDKHRNTRHIPGMGMGQGPMCTWNDESKAWFDRLCQLSDEVKRRTDDAL